MIGLVSTWVLAHLADTAVAADDALGPLLLCCPAQAHVLPPAAALPRCPVPTRWALALAGEQVRASWGRAGLKGWGPGGQRLSMM